MNKEVYKLLMVIVFYFVLNGLKSQDVIPSTGANISGSSGSISYTVGQIVWTSYSGSSGTIAQGVQQPYEIWVYSSVDEQNGIQIQCSVFPNPVKDNLILQVKDNVADKMSYKLYDINGKILVKKNMSGNETTISMSNLSAGTFFLKVFFKNKEFKTFKIIKH